jgi:hypothetical protein
MEIMNSVIAVFRDHAAAESAVKTLSNAAFDMKKLTVVGKGYHTEEKVVGFYNIGDRMKFWGTRGAFWGGLWGMLFGGLFLTVPGVGPVVVVGFLATLAIAAIENAVVVGGLSAIGAALFSIGIPKNSVIKYEAELKADGFMVMVHGTAEEMERAKALLAAGHPSSLEVHTLMKAPAADRLARAGV